MRRPWFLLALLLLSFAACSSKNKPDEEDDLPGPPNPDVEALAKDNNEFALALYGQVRSEPGNIFYSPFSVSSALAMTYAGARGQTQKEMAQAMRFRLEDERLHKAFGSLGKQLRRTKKGYQLSVANGLFLQKDYHFLPDFLANARDHYDAGIQEVDFVGEPEKTRQTMNRWVEQKTKDKIKDALPVSIMKPPPRLFLLNAIHFKGDWANEFKKDRTTSLPFHVSRWETVPTPMMSQKAEFGSTIAEGVQVLEMPYKGKDLSMVVLLPEKIDGLATLESELTAEKLTGWMSKLSRREIEVTFPKFKMTWMTDLSKVLQSMGMKSAFESEADLSGITGGRELYISHVLHKAFVDVNEVGTEAAAVTAVKTEAKGKIQGDVFKADHPFLFLIRDTRSGSILFLGRVTNPARV